MVARGRGGERARSRGAGSSGGKAAERSRVPLAPRRVAGTRLCFWGGSDFGAGLREGELGGAAPRARGAECGGAGGRREALVGPRRAGSLVVGRVVTVTIF